MSETDRTGTGGADPTDAGENSPHLDDKERRQAASSTPIGPLVIHEIVREQGEAELGRSFSGLAWSGLAAGLSIGFSFLAQGYLQAGLPSAPWSELVSSFGYSMGFLIVILGRQQLFTETTLTALIPALTRRNLPTLGRTMRVWAIVLASNFVGTVLFAAIASRPGVFAPSAMQTLQTIADRSVASPFWHAVILAGFAGWIMGLMVWLLPGSGPAKPVIVILLTYVIALCRFPHIVAGSVEGWFAVFTGHASVGAFALRFYLPTLLGNILGGTILAALLNHAPIATELGAEHDAG